VHIECAIKSSESLHSAQNLTSIPTFGIFFVNRNGLLNRNVIFLREQLDRDRLCRRRPAYERGADPGKVLPSCAVQRSCSVKGIVLSTSRPLCFIGAVFAGSRLRFRRFAESALECICSQGTKGSAMCLFGQSLWEWRVPGLHSYWP
jgi:hypothetical protein